MSTLGDIATIAAPTVVAVAAIGTSTWQQSRSRAFDRAEREKERQHDREMREAAERHERKLSDLDYQRQLVDDVTEALESAREAIWPLRIHQQRSYDFRGDEYAGIVERVSVASGRLTSATARMSLRFGLEHEAVTVVRAAGRAVDEAWAAAIGLRHSVIEPTQLRSIADASHETFSASVRSFLAVTGGVVGSAPELSPG